MQYFVLAICVIFATGSFIWAWYKISRMKALFLQKIIGQKIINCQLFSTPVVEELASFILKQPRLRQQKLLGLLSEHNFSHFIKLVEDPLLRAKLKLMLNGRRSSPKSADSLYILLLAWHNLHEKNYDAAVLQLNKLSKSSLNKTLSSLRSQIISVIALSEGDLETASQEAASALKYFQKHNMLFEEGQTYFILGSIYRVGGIFDTADFMFRAAIKVFRLIHASKYEAEALGTLGLLMSAQERFDEAFGLMEQAKKSFTELSDVENQAFVISQNAILHLLQKAPKKAISFAQQALKLHTSTAGKALASEIIARAAFDSGKTSTALKYALAASGHYQIERNYAAYFESLYLVAEILLKQGHHKKAEATLRKLISAAKQHKSCFHIAGAHTLLGVVLLQQNEVAQAKAVFNQALRQELYNDRSKGAAIDYFNLATVERKCGNLSKAKQNLEAALKYAQDFDEELCQIIKAALG